MPRFDYTGGVQTYTIPYTGIYHLMVVGANGAHGALATTAYGGCAAGYKEFKKGTTLYICCGQAGGYEGKAAYNGGGAGIVPTIGVSSWRYPSGSGGGATHIAMASGTLANVSDDDILIVAGGSGGDCASGNYEMYYTSGGSGGGTSGGKGGHYGGNGTNANPGTQNSGYAKGTGQKATFCEAWELGPVAAGGGGGGYWGGYAGNGAGGSGAGGSGYIGGVPASLTYKGKTYKAAMSNSYNSDGTNGYALIDLIAKTTLPVTFNGTTLEAIIFNGTEAESLIYNGTTLY